MDLLGSILKNMDAPPSGDKTKRKERQEQKAKLEKLQEEATIKREEFRTRIETEVNGFIKDSSKKHFKYPPMEKVERSIIHDVAEIAAITSYSFGEEGFDRHIILFKKEFAPSEDELAALRKGEDYDPEKIKIAVVQKKQTKVIDKRKSPKILPKSDYKEKYEHLIGKKSGKDSAKLTVTNDTFGCVPSENKKDLRSIEETLNEIRARKRQKTTNEEDTGPTTSAE